MKTESQLNSLYRKGIWGNYTAHILCVISLGGDDSIWAIAVVSYYPYKISTVDTSSFNSGILVPMPMTAFVIHIKAVRSILLSQKERYPLLILFEAILRRNPALHGF